MISSLPGFPASTLTAQTVMLTGGRNAKQGKAHGKRWFVMVASLLVTGLTMTAEVRAESCPIIPLPEHYQPLNRTVTLPAAANGVIAIDAKAAEPVQFAAERLQTSLVRLTGRKYEIVHAVPANTQLVIRMGEVAADLAVAGFCRQEKLDTASLTPKTDGFVIGFAATERQPQVICIGGSNPRSVIYGQDALTMLLQKSHNGYEFQAAAVFDQAKIRWRSFAWNQCSSYLQPGVLDAYADARLNCIELRDGPPPMWGQFGYPANWKIPGEPEKQVLREARRRGMFVYGVVCCGVPEKDNDNVLDKFQQLLELGVDGIYISFDDPGVTGDAVTLVTRILKLAQERGISHDRIAFLPPYPDYDCIYSDFNRNMLTQVPETADIRWFFTKSPSAERQMLVEDVGIRAPTGLFFNWPMNTQRESLPLYRFERSYICVPEFNDGWGRLSPDIFRQAHHTIDSVMVWVRGYPEYLAQLTGTWAWNPEKFDYPLARQRIYTRIYGADVAAKVNTFDNLFTELKFALQRIGPVDWAFCAWELDQLKTRPYALHLIAKMRVLQQEIAREAPSRTMLTQEELRNGYLDPMRKTLDWAKLLVATDFPEQIPQWKQYSQAQKLQVLNLIEKRFGREHLAKEYVDNWRKKLTSAKK